MKSFLKSGMIKMRQQKKDYFTKEDLRRLALEVNESLSDHDINIIFEKLDPENEEKCDFISFYKCMQEVVQKKFN